MEYEVNISPSDVDKKYMDEWGAAFLWLDDDHGVEYNLAYDTGECCSAIYKMEFDGEYMQTDPSTFSHYEIDFDDLDWEAKLVKEMEKVALEFWHHKEVVQRT